MGVVIALRALAWILLATIVVVTLAPPTFRPVSGMPSLLEHFAIFFLTGAVFALAYDVRANLLVASAVIFSLCL